MIESIETIKQWHKETFPDATLAGQLKKFQEEMDEFKTSEAEALQLEELADMVIVSVGVSRFDNSFGVKLRQLCYFLAADNRYDMTELWDTIDKKMEKNRARKWNKKDGLYKHVEE